MPPKVKRIMTQPIVSAHRACTGYPRLGKLSDDQMPAHELKLLYESGHC